jgi:glucan phosphoethanolaminetransferase (alkaline phosphatase superfamily)
MGRLRRILLGEGPRSLLLLFAPTLLALVVDVVLRGRLLAGYATQGKLIYLSSLLLSAAFWWLPLFVAARLAAGAAGATGPRRALARAALVLFFGLWVLPLAIFCFPGQVLYRSVFGAYMGRNTLRLGIAFKGTVVDWFASWAGPLVLAAIAGAGLLVTLGLAAAVRRVAAARPTTTPALAVVAFAASLVCFWKDQVDSRFLQAAIPDACFVHGLVHAARIAVTGRWGVRQGVSLRTPAALPPLASERARPPNVLLILTESVRADTLCSEPPPACRSEALDAVVPDRVPLGKLTTPTPNTFSACVALWTGLQANMDFASAHRAPVLWELARAVGYRTAYVTSQNPSYEDFGVYTRRAGIDVIRTATDLGGMAEEQIGAPDERATAAVLSFVKETTQPFFAVLQLANTHMPYRVDPALQPFAPHSGTPVGDIAGFHNQYRNSVLLQERTLAALLREVRAAPSWDDTIVVFLSDHGEQFREHRGLYHNHSLFQEELRIPGWLVAGARVLDADQRAALAAYARRRPYTQDVHATVVDLFGLHLAQETLPFAGELAGRSLLRPRVGEPMMLLATSTAVWEPTDARYGVLWGERVLVGSPAATWTCFNLARDPGEANPLPAERCGEMLPFARRAFAGADVPSGPAP